MFLTLILIKILDNLLMFIKTPDLHSFAGDNIISAF